MRQQLKYFPVIVFIIALVLGVHISISLGQKPSHSERLPSSVTAEDSSSFSQFDIGCGKNPVSFQTTSDQVRLKGCLGSLGAPIKIVNESTSMELTVLENEEMFTTDYFKLKPDKNFLKVSYKDRAEISIPIVLKKKPISH